MLIIEICLIVIAITQVDFVVRVYAERRGVLQSRAASTAASNAYIDSLTKPTEPTQQKPQGALIIYDPEVIDAVHLEPIGKNIPYGLAVHYLPAKGFAGALRIVYY